MTFILTFTCCSSHSEKSKLKANDESYRDTIKENTIIVDRNHLNEKVDSNRINYKDSNGLKQGQWITFDKKNNFKTIFTYRNDTLDGFYYKGNAGWRSEGTYKSGIYDGIQWVISGNIVQYYAYHVNGKLTYGACYAADRNLLVPIKGFSVLTDSTYVKAIHYNRKLWYEGLFVLRPGERNNNSKSTTPIDIHKIYFETGELRGIVDYKNKLITEYERTGRILYSTSFSNENIHRQHIRKSWME